MAGRRMIALEVVDSDDFLELPPSAQSLYFHLNVRADDDGFVGKPKGISRMVGAAEGDLRSLIDGGLLIAFEDGAVAIRHWHIHNLIRKDRYVPTRYEEDMEQLDVGKDGAYIIKGTSENAKKSGLQPSDNQVTTKWQPSDSQVTTNGCQSADKPPLQVKVKEYSSLRACAREEEPEPAPVSSGQPRQNDLPMSYGIDLDENALKAMFKDPAMGEAMLTWLQTRAEQGRFPYGSITAAIEQAKAAEKKYGSEKCIPVIQNAISGAYKRIIWEELEPRGRSGPPKGQPKGREVDNGKISDLEKRLLSMGG